MHEEKRGPATGPLRRVLRVLGIVLMLASVALWLAFDYPNLLPDSLGAMLPHRPFGLFGDWIVIYAVSGVGWLLYRRGTPRRH